MKWLALIGLLLASISNAQITTNPGPTQYPFDAWVSKDVYFNYNTQCREVFIAWNEVRAVALENFQAYELMWVNITTGSTNVFARGAAGTVITKTSVCSPFVSELWIRFGKNCQRDDPSKVWYDKTNTCTWEPWAWIWTGQNVFPPKPPTYMTT